MFWNFPQSCENIGEERDDFFSEVPIEIIICKEKRKQEIADMLQSMASIYFLNLKRCKRVQIL